MLHLILFLLLQIPSTDYDIIWLEDFINNPFPFDISLQDFEEQWPDADISTAAVKNMYDPSQNDTIIKIEFKKNKVNLQKTGKYTKLKSANINNDKVSIKAGIAIGMTKEELRAKFKDKPAFEKDAVLIYNKDQTARCIFLFKKGKLNSIRFDSL